MPEQHESKKCLACGGEALYIQDVDLVDKRVLGVQWCQAALYRCASCGHIELYQRQEDREWQERQYITGTAPAPTPAAETEDFSRDNFDEQ